ncbi:MAG: AI-2E family transporter [Novosphingobium sp.]
MTGDDATEPSLPQRWAPLTPGQLKAALVAFALLLLAGWNTLRIFLPALGWAAVFAISLWPWYADCRHRLPSRRRLLLPLGVTLLIVLMFVVPLILVGRALAQDSAAFALWLHDASAHGVAPPQFLSRLPQGGRLVAWWQAELGEPGVLARLTHGGPLSALPFDAGGRFIGAVLHSALLLLFTVLTLFFLLRDGEAIADGLRIAAVRAFGPPGERVGEQIVQAIRGTVNGLVVVGLGEGVLFWIAYSIAGAPHPALLGLVTGLLSAIPFGAVIAYAAAAALLAAGGEVGAGIGIAVFGSVVIFVADHFIRPALIGGTTRTPFLWVLLGILGGLEAWGLIGIVLGPALMAALLLLWREWTGVQEGPLNEHSLTQPEEPLRLD